MLSALASGVPATELGTTLHVPDARVTGPLAILESVGMIQDGGAGAYTLTAEAWVRFGRLLVSGVPALPTPASEPPITALPDTIETVARDLSYRFSSTFNAETVSRYVAESYLLLSQRARCEPIWPR